MAGQERTLDAAAGSGGGPGSDRRFDVAVIGSGMGGWAAVRSARRRGKRVALFERGAVGGT